MKLAAILAVTTLLVAGSVMAEPILPNIYECSGDDITLGYTTTSWTGEPTYTITMDKQTLTFEGEEIHSETTMIGGMVSAFDPHIACASISYTLVLPGVSLGITGEPQEFDTMFIRTFSGGRMHPDFAGVSNSSTYTPVTCKASAVDF